MSDSELSPACLPTKSDIEDCLRRIVRKGLKNEEDITVNKARERAEKELGLDEGFFKNDSKWKAKSKMIISDTAQEDEVEEDTALETPAKTPPKAKAQPTTKASKKRKSSDAPPARTKRRKKVESDDDMSNSFDEGSAEAGIDLDVKEDSGNESDSFAEDVTPVEPNKRRAPAKKSRAHSDSEKETKPKAKAVKNKAVSKKSKNTVVAGSQSEAEAPPKKATKTKGKKPPAKAMSNSEEDTKAESKSSMDASELSDPPAGISDTAPKADHTIPSDNESEMSVLIDEPPKKKRNSKASVTEPKSKASKSSTAASKKKGEPLSRNEEEIKRLQGWLVKCGLRKLWHRELANCDTEKAKIQHLKKMLEDAGMEGRPSNEKAKQIKEARELREEIEAAKEFEKRWGQGKEGRGDGSDGDGSGGEESERDENPGKADAKPKRVLPMGLVDFGDSGDDSD
jgi:hypothetical protein